MAPAKVSVKISVATISSDKVNPSFRVRQVFDLDTAISLSLEIKNLLPFRTIGGVSFSNICMIQGTHETHAFVRGNWLSFFTKDDGRGKMDDFVFRPSSLFPR